MAELSFLADVALGTALGTRPYIPTIKLDDRRRLATRSNLLRIKKINGEEYSRIKDLIRIPLNSSKKLFFDAFKDSTSRGDLIFVCKFEHKHVCNATFFGKENHLDHLVRLHLLTHLIKTKEGSMIKLPKLDSAPNRVIPSSRKSRFFSSAPTRHIRAAVHKSRFNTRPRSNKKYEEIVWGDEKTSVAEVVTAPSKPTPFKELKMNSADLNTRAGIGSLSTAPDATLPFNEIRRIKSDHPYCGASARTATNSGAGGTEPSSDSNSVLENEHAPILDQGPSVSVNQFCYLNTETSSELSSFMMHQTLNSSVSMISTGDGESTFVQLPLVESEVEVSTEEGPDEAAITAKPGLKLDEPSITCYKCDIVFSSKQVLCSHMRNKHFDTSVKFKPYKEAARTRTAAAEPKTVKRKFEMRSEYRNADPYEVVKENNGSPKSKRMNTGESILKTALLKESNNKPKINLSNVLNSINVQYV